MIILSIVLFVRRVRRPARRRPDDQHRARGRARAGAPEYGQRTHTVLADPQVPVFQTAIGDDGRVYIKISGELDITTVPDLAGHLARLADLRPTRLFIDMSGVSFLDCASARLLADTAAFLPPGRQPVITSVRPTVRRLLELTGLAGIIQIAD